MPQSVVIHAYIDLDTKAATEKVLEALGITPNEAICLLYRQIAMRGKFPVELSIPNAQTTLVLAKAEKVGDTDIFDSTDDLYASWD